MRHQTRVPHVRPSGFGRRQFRGECETTATNVGRPLVIPRLILSSPGRRDVFISSRSPILIARRFVHVQREPQTCAASYRCSFSLRHRRLFRRTQSVTGNVRRRIINRLVGLSFVFGC